MTARHLALVTRESLLKELAAYDPAAADDAREAYKGGVVFDSGFHPLNQGGAHGEPIDVNSEYPAEFFAPRPAAEHLNAREPVKCPACGAALRYRVGGSCRACGHYMGAPVSPEFPGAL